MTTLPYIWRLTIIIMIIVSLTACGEMPLAVPEQIDIITPIKPLPSPSLTSQPTQQVAPTPTSIPLVETETPAAQSILVVTPPPPTPKLLLPPTPGPTFTPTPTFEPLSDKPIGGYVFGEPEEVPGLDNSVNLNLSGWVPDSKHEIVVTGDKFVDRVNIKTGEKQRLFEWDDEIWFSVGDPVWVQSSQTSALIMINSETKQYELWVNSSAGQDVVRQPTLTNIQCSFIPVNSGHDLVVYDLDQQVLKTISAVGLLVRYDMAPLRVIPPESANFRRYTVKYLNDLAVYYKQDDLLVVNLKTQEVKELSFDDPFTTIWDVEWRGDGEKLALLLSEAGPPIHFLDLYIYDPSHDELQYIDTSFTRFVDNITWAPDNRHLVISAVIGDAEYQTSYGSSFVSRKNALFLVDTATMKSSPLPIKNPDIATSGPILWSPDGQYLIARYRFYERGILTYHTEVVQQ